MVFVSALCHAVARHVNHAVGAQRPGEHADQRHPTDVRICRRLHYFGGQWPRRVAGQCRDLRTVERHDWGQRMLEWRRECVRKQLEEFGAADAGRPAHTEHRIERPAGDCLFEILDHDFHVDVLAREVAVHQRLVFALGDDSFEQGVAGPADGRELCGVRGPHLLASAAVVTDLPAQQSQQSRHRAVGRLDRYVQRQHADAEGRLTRTDYRVEIGSRGIEFRDDDRTRHADLRAFLPEHPGGTVDPVYC